MSKRISIKAGDRYGRLTILREVEPVITPTNKQRCFECVCDCGSVKRYRLCSMRSGGTVSCGCFAKEVASESARTHGLSSSVEYGIWSNMIRRCNNENDANYHNYGGRGIAVCDRWRQSFSAFYEDMGARPSVKHSIDRINNNGNYEPSNCRWATAKEQSRNKRMNYLVEYNGETKCVSEWAEVYGFKPSILYNRLVKQGWPFEKAVSWPVADRRDVRSRNPHYRVAIRNRDAAWHREHERIEAIRIERDCKRLEFSGEDLAKTHRVEAGQFVKSVQTLLKDGWTWNGAVFKALKDLGAIK